MCWPKELHFDGESNSQQLLTRMRVCFSEIGFFPVQQKFGQKRWSTVSFLDSVCSPSVAHSGFYNQRTEEEVGTHPDGVARLRWRHSLEDAQRNIENQQRKEPMRARSVSRTKLVRYRKNGKDLSKRPFPSTFRNETICWMVERRTSCNDIIDDVRHLLRCYTTVCIRSLKDGSFSDVYRIQKKMTSSGG